MTENRQTVLLIGGTQYSKKHIAKALSAYGIPLKIMVRSKKSTANMTLKNLEWAEAIPTQPQTMTPHFDGVHTVISVIDLPEKRKSIFEMGISYATNINIVKEAARAGVAQLIFVVPSYFHQFQYRKTDPFRKEFITVLQRSNLKHEFICIQQHASGPRRFITSLKTIGQRFFSKEPTPCATVLYNEIGAACVRQLQYQT